MSRNVLIIGIMVLSATASLGLGVLAAGQGAAGANGLVVSSIPLSHPEDTSLLSASVLDSVTGGSATTTIPSGGEVVGDSSSRSYYLPWCAHVGKIVRANEIWFVSEQAAQNAGYTPGKSCKGI